MGNEAEIYVERVIFGDAARFDTRFLITRYCATFRIAGRMRYSQTFVSNRLGRPILSTFDK
jgi:hypothetical protein